MDNLRRKSSRLVPRKSMVSNSAKKKNNKKEIIKKANARLSAKRKQQQAEPAPEPMPSPDEINKRYDKILVEMAIPKNKQDQLLKQSDDIKWRLIQAHENFTKRGGGDNAEKNSPEHWIGVMHERENGEPCLTVNEATELQTVLRTAHKTFLIDFIESDGISELNDLTMYYATLMNKTDEEKAIVAQLVLSYKVLMNNNIGMEGALIVKGTIETIAMAMDYIDGRDPMTTTEQVVLLLSVTCWWSEEGRKQVVEAMQAIRLRRREANRYQTLVYMLEHTSNVSFKASIATFITTVCNTATKIEDRIPVRNDFLTLDIIKVFNRVLKHAKDSTTNEEEESWAQVQKQYEVFASIMNADHKEIVHKMIRNSVEDDEYLDLSKPDQVWHVVTQNARKADTPDQLLKLTQALLMIPTENTLALPIIDAITRYVHEATSFERVTADGKKKTARKSLTAAPPLNYASLGKLFDSKLEMDAKLSQLTSSDEIIAKQREKLKTLGATIQQLKKSKGSAATTETEDDTEGIKILKEKNKNLIKTIEDLEKQLAEARTNGPPPAKGGQKAVAAVAAAAKPRDSLLQSFKGKLDSTGLVPAGIAPGRTPKDPPPCPKSGMPGSLENAPIEVKQEAAPSGGGGLADMLAKKQAAAAKKKGPNKKAKMKAALEKLGLPEKKPIKPSVKMTHLFWNVVTADKLEGTIWPELSDQTVKFDAKHFEQTFGKKQDVGKQLTKKNTMATLKPTTVHLVDPQRLQNLGIALRRMRLKNREIKNAIITMDDTILSPQTVLVLIDMCPTPDEKTLLDKYMKDGSDPKMLGVEDQYLMEVNGIPRLQERLVCLRTKQGFGYAARKVLESTKLVRNAIVEVEKSEPLRKILEIILALGNYANGGTARGGAWGFKLDVLAKVGNVKDNTPKKTTMIHYIYHLLEDNYPEVLKEFKLPASSKASTLSLTDVMGELNELAKSVQMIKNEVKNPPFMKGDNFQKIMEKFEVRASKDVTRLQSDFEKVRSDFSKLALRFAESGPQVQPNTFFSNLVSFESELKRAKKQIMEEREAAERKDKAAKEQLRRQTLRKLKKLQASTGDPDLFDAYKKANSGDTAQVIEEFINRYKAEKKKAEK